DQSQSVHIIKNVFFTNIALLNSHDHFRLFLLVWPEKLLLSLTTDYFLSALSGLAGQIPERINRLTVLPDFKVQHHFIGAGRTYLGNLPARFNNSLLAYQNSAGVGIGTQVGIVVFDDDQIAVSAQPLPRI